MSFTFVQKFSLIDDGHKELSFFLKIDFKIKIKILNTWIFLDTYPNGMKFFPHM